MTEHVPAALYAKAAGDEVMLARLVKEYRAAQGSRKRRMDQPVEPEPEPLVEVLAEMAHLPGPWVLSIEGLGRPPTTNVERTSSMSKGTMAKVRAVKRDWGSAVKDAAKAAGIPRLERAYVVLQPFYPNNKVPDPDALSPAVKAVMDGLVQAGVLADDRRAQLPLGFHTLPPYSDGGPPRMTVTVYPLS